MPNYPEPKFRGPKRTKAPRPLSRVELHIHLDGSLRMSTIWEISKAKGLSLPGDGSLEALAAHVEMAAPADLTEFLSGFQYTAPALVGDMAAVERVSAFLGLNCFLTIYIFQIAVEFCEDAAYNGVLYVESRFCPNFLVGDSG